MEAWKAESRRHKAANCGAGVSTRVSYRGQPAHAGARPGPVPMSLVGMAVIQGHGTADRRMGTSGLQRATAPSAAGKAPLLE